MLNAIRRMPLLSKLMLIGLIPFCFLLFLTMQVYKDSTEKVKLFANYKTYLSGSANISNVINALQDERKFSFDYAMTRSMWQELVLQRPQTDSLLYLIESSDDPSIAGFKEYTRLKNLAATRKQIDTFGIAPSAVMHFYSNTVFRLNTLNTIPPANTPYLNSVHKHLVAHKVLSEMITYLGIIRSNIYNVLHTRQYMVETMVGTLGIYDVFKSYEAELLVKASPAVKEEYTNGKMMSAYQPTITYIDTLFKKFSFDSTYTASQWWKVSDEGSDALQALQNKIWIELNANIDKLYANEIRERNQTFAYLLITLLSVIGIVAFIVHIISRSINELKTAAERIARGETGIKIEPLSNDVIGSLANSISAIDTNSHALSLAATQIGKGNFDVHIPVRSEKDQLGNAIVQMKQSLQEYNAGMEKLVEARTEALERSNNDLQQFAYVASHDLQEPLRKISIFSRIILNEERYVVNDNLKVYLNKIHVAAQRMSAMIEGVLAYSTVNVKEEQLEWVNLEKVMEGVVSDLELAIVQKQALVEYSKLPLVKGIPPLLHQLLYNLVNNALKFTRPGVQPHIVVAATPATKINGDGRDFIHITIKDNGIGFKQEFAVKMFDIFSRLNARDMFEGTGLGLALCKKIVSRHNGQIQAEGKEEKGSTFHIYLPVG